MVYVGFILARSNPYPVTGRVVIPERVVQYITVTIQVLGIGRVLHNGVGGEERANYGVVKAAVHIVEIVVG